MPENKHIVKNVIYTTLDCGIKYDFNKKQHSTEKAKGLEMSTWSLM